MTPQSTLKLSLLENGLDSLVHAVEHLSGEPTPRDVKQGLLNLADGVELVLKERLFRDDWQLLFEDPARANELDLRTGDFFSAKPVTTIERLRNDVGVPMAPEALQRLRLLRETRNRVRHFAIDQSMDAVLTLAASALGFTVDFVTQELEPLPDGPAADDLARLREALRDYNAFVTARWDDIKSRVDAAQAVVDCPRCLEPAAILDDGPSCLFCGFTTDAEDGAADYASSVLGVSYYERVKDGGDWVVSLCPNCERLTLVDEGLDGEAAPSRRWVCFGCASTWDEGRMETCSRCGGWYASDNGMAVCNDCFEYAISSPD